MGISILYIARKVIFLFVLASPLACKKDGSNTRTVSDTIYGQYLTTTNSGSWWIDLLSGTFIKVSPHESNRIEIITNYNSPYPVYTLVFDSVTLYSDKSCAVTQIIEDGQSASGYSDATGNGHFGTKTISLNFIVTRNGPIGNDRIVLKNVKKVSD